MTRLFSTAAALVLGATAASAQTGIDPVVQELTRQGYSEVEVKREGGSIEVEARRGTEVREITYDANTGSMLSDERTIDASERRALGPSDVPGGIGSVVSSLARQGYTVVEIANGTATIELEAVRGREVRELVYDAQTGGLLSDETETDEEASTELSEEEPGRGRGKGRGRGRGRGGDEQRSADAGDLDDEEDDRRDDEDDENDSRDDEDDEDDSRDDEEDDGDRGGNGGRGGRDGGGAGDDDDDDDGDDDDGDDDDGDDDDSGDDDDDGGDNDDDD